jgi:hypothetical protein
MFEKLAWRLQKAAWWMQKRRDERKSPTDSDLRALQRYYDTATGIFDQLGIDVKAKPADVQRLYFMMLLYLDNEEVICPAAARTASLIGFLDTTGAGWAMPPTSQTVTPEFAKDVDGYFAMEIFRNYRGLEDIHTELVDAINRRNAELQGGT